MSLCNMPIFGNGSHSVKNMNLYKKFPHSIPPSFRYTFRPTNQYSILKPGKQHGELQIIGLIVM